MQLNLGNVDIRAAMAAAAAGVQDRLAGPGLTLDISAPKDIGAFTADEREAFTEHLERAIATLTPRARQSVVPA